MRNEMKHILIILCLIIPATLTGQVKCSSEPCSTSEALTANADLILSNAEMDSIADIHLFKGKPLNRKNRDRVFLVHKEFVTCYDTAIKLPLWSSYLLTEDFANDTRNREDCFRDDPRMYPNSNQTTCDYYSGSGYNRGHISPRNDFNRSQTAMHNTYLFTNMVPQKAPHNQSTWRYTEEYINDLAEDQDSIYIVTGILFDYNEDNLPDEKDTLPMIADDRPLAIPSHFYKIIVKAFSDEEMYSLALVVPHDSSWRGKQEVLDYLKSDCISTIDHIEKVSGFNFFWRLENDIEQEVEGVASDELW